MVDLIDILSWCFQQNYSLDKSNAAIHCAPVKYSPITFRLCQALISLWPQDEDYTQEMAEVREHLGKYEEDRGR